MRLEQAQLGILALTCVPALTMACVYHQKKVMASILTASLFTWDARAREDIRVDSVIVILTPAN